MIISPTLIASIERELNQAIADCRILTGGDISQVVLLTLTDGRQLVLKHNRQAPERMLSAEATGLRTLRASGAIDVPEVLAELDKALLLEYIPAGHRSEDFWPLLGTRLAGLHRHTGKAFGFDSDNYCGLTPQSNTWTLDGHVFFAEQRLLYQGKLARSRRLLDREAIVKLERLSDRLPQLVPQQPPSLIHGDLWAGNLLCNRAGQPVLIDPAAYYGWAEAELAMTSLFGGFAEAFYRAYEQSSNLEPGWRERLPLYNLYHLLNHLNLFGSAYRPQVLAVLSRYS